VKLTDYARPSLTVDCVVSGVTFARRQALSAAFRIAPRACTDSTTGATRRCGRRGCDFQI
jgi:hypothetical protein